MNKIYHGISNFMVSYLSDGILPDLLGSAFEKGAGTK